MLFSCLLCRQQLITKLLKSLARATKNQQACDQAHDRADDDDDDEERRARAREISAHATKQQASKEASKRDREETHQTQKAAARRKKQKAKNVFSARLFVRHYRHEHT